MNNLYNRINQILSYYFDDNKLEEFGINKKFKPKLWNADTDFIKTFERFDLKIKKINKDILIIDLIKEESGKFILQINGENVTPNNNFPNPVSYSAARQYLQVLSWINVIIFDKIDKKKKTQSFRVSSNFQAVINKMVRSRDSSIESIEEIISHSIKRNVSHVRNLGFTYFISILNNYDLDFSKIKNEYKKINKITNKDGVATFLFGDKYSDDYFTNMMAATTRSIIPFFAEKDINYFVDNILNNVTTCDDNLLTEKQIKENNMVSNLNKERSKFKENILNDRIALGLIDGYYSVYSDLIDCRTNLIRGLSAKINDLHACHIKEYKQIKKELIAGKNYGDGSLKETSDPSNGILMKPDYHKYFDGYLFNFDINGEMIYSKENEKYLFEDGRLIRAKINPIVLNNGNMKYFLKQRGIVNTKG